jgi:hypothetical protein
MVNRQQQQQLQPTLSRNPLKDRIAPTVEPPATEPKAGWGKPTWFLFHTLAHKIREEDFPRLKNELLNIINIICINLPCPMCASHATKYMENINFNTIQTKEQLKDMLFVFHNTVNSRKNYPLFTKEELNAKYQTANLLRIIQNFMYHFRDNSKNLKLISNEMYRNMALKQVTTWLNKNIQSFNP